MSSTRAFRLGLLTVLAPASAVSQLALDCAAGRTDCVAVTPFVVAVTNFRTSESGTDRLVTLTLRIHNRLDRPLTLAYVDGSGVATDDRGNRYLAHGPAVRGIGLVTGTTFDPKFTLQPGESGDARIEFGWRPTRGAIYGTTYEADLALREVDPVTETQSRLGREHTLHFSGFGKGVSAAEPAPAAPQPAEPAPEAEADLCAGRPGCWNEGGIVAEVTSLQAGPIGGRHHQLTITLKVTNRSPAPVILGYKSATSGAIDNLGNRYYWGRPGTHDGSFKGIGLVSGRSADPQFALRPGQARSATFGVIRYEAGNRELGTSFSWDLVLTELEILPSRQIRAGRDHSIAFAELGPRRSGGDVAKSLLDKVLKKP